MSQPASNPAQQLLQVPCTGVLVQLTIKPGVNPQSVMPHMPAEVRDTVLLYLDGHISQWGGAVRPVRRHPALHKHQRRGRTKIS